MLPQPGLLLLFWCGIAATIVARPIARHARTPAARSGHVRTLLADLVLFPLLYAVALELIGHADLATGAMLGAAHAAIDLGAGLARGTRMAHDVPIEHGARVRGFLARTLYGIVFAFLYIVPAA